MQLDAKIQGTVHMCECSGLPRTLVFVSSWLKCIWHILCMDGKEKTKLRLVQCLKTCYGHACTCVHLWCAPFRIHAHAIVSLNYAIIIIDRLT